uniref:Melatonin receptor 1B n=1 Tax=Felis catus TaxID=9685 RepID=A0ABI7YW31_FELCA
MAGGAVAGARGAGGSRMPENISYANCCEAGELAMRPDWPGTGRARPSGTARPLWEAPALSTVLIVTTAVDVVGNLLVILSVLRNRKLRNAETAKWNAWEEKEGGPQKKRREPMKEQSRREKFSNL